MALERLRKEIEELEITEVSRKNFLVYKKEGNVINNEINDDRFTGKKKKNYKSPDLQIVIFLQLMEIERLTLENQRMKEKDFSAPYLVNCIELDRVSQEYSKLKEIHTKEMIRTRELETKVFDFEGKVALMSQEIERLKMLLETRTKETRTYKDELDAANSKLRFFSNAETEVNALKREIERLKMVITSKDNEVEKWKRDYTELLGNYKGLEDKNSLLEKEIHRLNNIYNSLNSEFKEKIRVFENDIKGLKEEIDRLNKLLEVRDNEIEEWRVKFTRVEMTLKDFRILQKKHKELEGLVQEYEVRIEKYEKEMDDYNKLKQALKEAELKIAKLLADIRDLATEIGIRDTRIEEYKGIIEEWERKLQPSFDRIKELEIKLSKLQKEHEICASIKKKLKELESKESSTQQEIQELRKQLEFKNGEIEKWKYEYSLLECRVEQLSVFEERVYEYEDQKNIMNSEINRLNQLLRQRNEQITVLKVEITRLQFSIKEYKGLSKDYERAEERIEQISKANSDFNSRAKGAENDFGKEKEKLIRVNVKLKGDIADLREKLKTATQKLDSLREMNESLSGDVNAKSNELLKLKRKHERLKILIDKFREMEGKFIDSEIFIKEFRPLLIKYFQLENDQKEHLTLISEYESSVSIMKQEIVRLKTLTHALQDELDLSKGGHSICEVRFKDYEERLSFLGQEIERLQVGSRMKATGVDKNEIEKITFELRRVNTISMEKEEKIIRLNESIDRMKIEISEKDSRIANLEMEKKNWTRSSSGNESKVSTMEQEVIRLRGEVESKRTNEGNLMTKVAMLTSEIERLNYRLSNESNASVNISQLTGEVERYRREVSEKENRIITLNSRISEIETQLFQRDQRITSLSSEKSRFESQLREVEMSSSSILELQEKLSLTTQEVTRLRAMLSDKERQIRELSSQDISDLEMKIAFTTQELERQRHLVREKDSKIEGLETELRSYKI